MFPGWCMAHVKLRRQSWSLHCEVTPFPPLRAALWEEDTVRHPQLEWRSPTSLRRQDLRNLSGSLRGRPVCSPSSPTISSSGKSIFKVTLGIFFSSTRKNHWFELVYLKEFSFPLPSPSVWSSTTFSHGQEGCGWHERFMPPIVFFFPHLFTFLTFPKRGLAVFTF